MLRDRQSRISPCSPAAMTLPLPCPNNLPCFTVLTLDAGQGDCTLLVYPDQSVVMIDCGSKKNKSIVHDQIKLVVDAYLGRTNKRLKALVLTHPDADHYNLVKALRGWGVTIDTLIYGGVRSHYTLDQTGDWIKKHEENTASPRTIVNTWSPDPQHTSWNVVPQLSYKHPTDASLNVDVRILAANAGDPSIKTDANPNSIVLLATYQWVNLFLMGDATALTENFILRHRGTDLDTVLTPQRGTLLRVGHHGSTTSTTQEWVTKLKPAVAIVSSDTLTFSGTSIPSRKVLTNLQNLTTLHDFGIGATHYYVQYNDDSTSPGHLNHEEVQTTRALFTTLHRLRFDPVHPTEFTAYGTSWYYTVSSDGSISVDPAVGWDQVNATP